MIATLKTVKASPQTDSLPDWHHMFMAMLPAIRRRASLAFRDESNDQREELIQEVVCNALFAFKRLYDKGKVDLAYPTVLALYAIRQVRDGRQVAGRRNIDDVMSRHAQQRRGIKVERLDRFQKRRGEWIEAVIEDRRTSIPDQVAFRIDFPAWLSYRSTREREIIEMLSLGYTTNETARRFRINTTRISQLRRKFQRDWLVYQGDETTIAANSAID